MIVSAKNIRRAALACGAMLLMGLGLLYLYASQLSSCVEFHGERPHLVVARVAQTIPAGSVLTPDLVTYEKVEERFLPPHVVHRGNVNSFMHQRTNLDLEQGSMILTSDFDQTNPTWRSPGSAYQH